MRFDLLVKGGTLVVKGGTLVDPGGGYAGDLDIAIRRGRISAVERNIPETACLETLDAAGIFVIPGLIDLHSHVYTDATFWGVDADAIGSRSGVTTWVDAGSSGACTL